MKKRVILIIMFLMFMVPSTALAYRIPCTKQNMNKLKNAAYKVNLTYEFKEGENRTHYFEVYVSGLTEGLEARYGNTIVNYDANQDVHLIFTNESGNASFGVDIYAGEGTACDGYKLITKSISLPKYNPYSEREECIEYEEFRLCNKWSKENIPNSTYFDDELAKYKESIEKDTDNPEKPKANIFEKLINIYMDNLGISIPITIVLVIGLLVVIVRSIIRRKNRIKIDINVKR